MFIAGTTLQTRQSMPHLRSYRKKNIFVATVKRAEICAFFIDALDDPQSLLSQRLMLLNNYLKGIDLQIATIKGDIPSIAEANIERAKFIVEAEIAGTESLIRAVSQ